MIMVNNKDYVKEHLVMEFKILIVQFDNYVT